MWMLESLLTRRKQCLVALMAAGSLVPVALSSQTPQIVPSDATASSSTSTSRYLRVTINPSTANIVEGAVYGLDAELDNVSNVPVIVQLSNLQLAVQPELAPADFSCTWFYDASTNGLASIAMLPGDHFTVFFDTGAKANAQALKDDPVCAANFWSRLRRRLDFVPGNYSFVVIGKFTFTPPTPIGTASGSAPPDPGGSAKPEEHYFAQTASLPVSIDQAQIILYAGLGGLLAFLVMSFRRANTLSEYAGTVQAKSSDPARKVVIILREAGGAILLSATVTVIAARLSTAAFPVKVSVNDFWGALTVGFVAYFVGGSFIDKLSGLTSGPQPAPAQNPPAPAQNPPAAVPSQPAPVPNPPAPAIVGGTAPTATAPDSVVPAVDPGSVATSGPAAETTRIDNRSSGEDVSSRADISSNPLD
jgi:hypothetical protein